MKKSVSLMIGIIAFASALSGQEDLCSKEVLTSYFPKPFVLQTLEENQVPEEERLAIAEELSGKDAAVVHIVEARASRMNPNPLRHPAHKMKAAGLFRDVMLEVFSEVMGSHGIYEQGQLEVMLDDIQYQKAKQLSKCMVEYREEKKKRSPINEEPSIDVEE